MVPALALVGMVLLAGLGSGPSRARALALAAVSVLWLVTNSPMEGDVLIALSDDHGLTAGDLPGIAGLGLAAWLFLAASRDRSRDRERLTRR